MIQSYHHYLSFGAFISNKIILIRLPRINSQRRQSRARNAHKYHDKGPLAITGLITRRIRTLDREPRSALQYEIRFAIEAGYRELKERPVIVERSPRGTYGGHRSPGKTDRPSSRESLISRARPRAGNALRFASDQHAHRRLCTGRASRSNDRRCQGGNFVNGHLSRIGRGQRRARGRFGERFSKSGPGG